MKDRISEILSFIRSEDTRLNSSHVEISYAVFCLKKKQNESKSLAGLVERKTLRIGPGISRNSDTSQFVRAIVTRSDNALVVVSFFLKTREPPNSKLFPTAPPFG